MAAPDPGRAVRARFGDAVGGSAAAGSYNQLWGGAGGDTASYAGTSGKVYASIEGSSAYVDSGAGYAITDAYNSIENLTGGSGNDVLIGDAGANRLQGGAGADQLYGRGGADTFVYAAYADSTIGGGYDTIADFQSGADKLDLTALGLAATQVQITTGGGSTSVYAFHTPGAFNPSPIWPSALPARMPSPWPTSAISDKRDPQKWWINKPANALVRRGRSFLDQRAGEAQARR